MKKVLFILISIFAQKSLHATLFNDLPKFNKVIIWGHKFVGAGTHSYIHYAFHKAFKYLGYDTYCFDNSDNVSNFDFTNCLFITEGQVDQKMPLRDDCRYVLHNCCDKRYKPFIKKGNCIYLQVYTHDCLPRKVQKIEPCIYYDFDEKVLYMPWATDLLPHEIDEIKMKLPIIKKNNNVMFVGSIYEGTDGNAPIIINFMQACMSHGIPFIHKNCSIEDNINLVQKAFMAPALQSKWQCDVGYIPCRIFKNISYGQMGITNSRTVYELFNRKIIYHEDCNQLFKLAQQRLKTITINDIYELMDFVRDHHTYLNRIGHIFNFFNLNKC